MFEKTYAIIVLFLAGMITPDDYNSCLDKIFLENPENDLLTDLEFASNDFDETRSIINEYILKTKLNIDYSVFGSALFEKISEVYNNNITDIEFFACKAYSVWKLLPHEISAKEPFWTLSYADECLSYGDEKQTRKLYEETFSYKWN